MKPITVGNLLKQVAETYPNAQAVKCNDRDYTRTWKEFNEECERVARGMMAAGIGKGDHVAIWATNVPQWLVTLFATAKIGAVLVTVNTNYKVFELEYLLKQSDAKALVMVGSNQRGSDYVDIINKLCPSLKDSDPGALHEEKVPCLETVIYIGEDHPAGMYHWNEMFAMADLVSESDFRAVENSLDPDEVINMQYTSGTTGFPKGVMLTHNNIVRNGRQIGDCMNFSNRDKLCIPVPFFHCFGLVLATMASVTHATSMVPVDVFSAEAVMKAVSEEKCTALHGVPTMFIAVLDHPDFDKYDYSSLRTGIMAGSPCPTNVMKKVISDMGMHEITIAFGQTESSPVCTQTTVDDTFENRVSTVGKALPEIEVKIVDPDTCKDLGPGVQGELCIRGYSIMKGYYKMPEETAQVIDKAGWLHTGDLATVDEKGYYKITGRIKDMIIRGGENIYPKEIEEFLYTLPMVKDVQVVGVPSARYGEEIMACIIPKDGVRVDVDEIRDIVRANMARHKVPKYVEFMESFPMTASGKIQKYRIRKWAIKNYGLESAAREETA